MRCTHFDRVHLAECLPTGCEKGLAAGRLDRTHLRGCQECEQVGCRDQPPGRHAIEHFFGSARARIPWYEPGGDWYWCHVDELVLELEGVPHAPSYT